MPATTQAQAMEQAFNAATRAPISELAEKLQAVLSRTVTAYAANVRDAKTVSRWANGEVQQIRDDEIAGRVRMTYQIVTFLEMESSSPQTIRAWFVSLNPRLGDTMPSQAIRDGRLAEVRDAAQAFVINP